MNKVFVSFVLVVLFVSRICSGAGNPNDYFAFVALVLASIGIAAAGGGMGQVVQLLGFEGIARNLALRASSWSNDSRSRAHRVSCYLRIRRYHAYPEGTLRGCNLVYKNASSEAFFLVS